MARKRALVAMSGGVDSSVAALLVQQQGYEVVGATLNLWSYANRVEPYNECCSLEVRAVAGQLGIEHHVLDCGSDFKTAVVDPFVEDYLGGRTPSPCGHCNRLVRFPLLLEAMERLGCDALVTGHHARIETVDGDYALLRGADPFKDQSYFLYGLDPARLEQILFPVGGMFKDDVWALARRHSLVSARKPESQDLCFLPRGDYRAFLRQHAPESIRPGEIIDTEGNALGEHEGLPFYTIGQRRRAQPPHRRAGGTPVRARPGGRRGSLAVRAAHGVGVGVGGREDPLSRAAVAGHAHPPGRARSVTLRPAATRRDARPAGRLLPRRARAGRRRDPRGVTCQAG